MRIVNGSAAWDGSPSLRIETSRSAGSTSMPSGAVARARTRIAPLPVAITFSSTVSSVSRPAATCGRAGSAPAVRRSRTGPRRRQVEGCAVPRRVPQEDGSAPTSKRSVPPRSSASWSTHERRDGRPSTETDCT